MMFTSAASRLLLMGLATTVLSSLIGYSREFSLESRAYAQSDSRSSAEESAPPRPSSLVAARGTGDDSAGHSAELTGTALFGRTSTLVDVHVHYDGYWLAKKGNDILCFVVPPGSFVVSADFSGGSSIGDGAYLWNPRDIKELERNEAEGVQCINIRWWKNPGYSTGYDLRVVVLGSGIAPQVSGTYSLPGDRPLMKLFVGDGRTPPYFMSNQY